MPDDGLPENCPPPGAVPRPGTYYRLAEGRHSVGDQAARGSWRKPWKMAGPMKDLKDVCEAHALSVMADLEDAEQFRRLAPWARKKSLARVEVGPDDGDLLHTPKDDCRSHHDWWTKPYNLTPASNEVIRGAME